MSVYSPFSLFIAVSSFLNLIIFYLILIYFIAHLHIYNPSVLSFSKSSFGLFITCLRYSLLHTTKCKCTFRNTSTNVFTGSHFQVKRRLSRRLIVPICIAVYVHFVASYKNNFNEVSRSPGRHLQGAALSSNREVCRHAPPLMLRRQTRNSRCVDFIL